MKKRKFENGGSTDDYVPRKRGLRREGTNELVLDSEGMPILTVGAPDTDTEAAIAKATAKATEKSRPRMDQPFGELVPGKESRLAKFIKSFIRQKPSANRVTAEELRLGNKEIKDVYANVRDDEEIASGRLGTTKTNPEGVYNRSDRLKENMEKARKRLMSDSEKGRYASDEAETDKGQFLNKGGKVASASKRADGIAQRGKTKGRYI